MWNKCFVFGVVIVMLQSGCSSLSSLKNRDSLMFTRENNQKQTAEQQTASGNPTAVTKMAVLWKENMIQVPGKPNVRGFTGRVYFYDSNDEPAAVDGELTVYAYDDSDDFDGDVPDREYIFPPEDLAKFYSPSELGDSYSLWIPWGPKEGWRKSVTLIPIFRSADNKIIEGPPSRVTLSGKVPPEAAINKTFGPRPHRGQSQNSIYQHADFAKQGERRLVDTISVPREIAERLHGVPENRLPDPNIRLAELDSPQVNPNGELYNQVSIQHQISRSAGQPFVPRYTAAEQPPQQAHQIPPTFDGYQNRVDTANHQSSPGQRGFVTPAGGNIGSTPRNNHSPNTFGRPGLAR